MTLPHIALDTSPGDLIVRINLTTVLEVVVIVGAVLGAVVGVAVLLVLVADVAKKGLGRFR